MYVFPGVDFCSFTYFLPFLLWCCMFKYSFYITVSWNYTWWLKTPVSCVRLWAPHLQCANWFWDCNMAALIVWTIRLKTNKESRHRYFIRLFYANDVDEDRIFLNCEEWSKICWTLPSSRPCFDRIIVALTLSVSLQSEQTLCVFVSVCGLSQYYQEVSWVYTVYSVSYTSQSTHTQIQMQILEVTQHGDRVWRDLFKNGEVRVIK